MAYTILLHEPLSPLAPSLLRQMYALRHRVFKERMGWDVGFVHDLERDCYDLMSPVYALAINAAGRTVGCWRLMPTTGPYLLKDAFGPLLNGQPAPASPLVWEASRFAVDTDEESVGPGAVTAASAALMAALLEFGLAFGLEKIVAVSDLRFERLLHRGGLATERFGPAHQVGTTRAVAGWFDVTAGNLERVRETNHLSKPVLWTSSDRNLVRAA